MTAWETIIAEQIDARHRAASAGWGPTADPSGGTQKLNAAFLACRSVLPPPPFLLGRESIPKGDEVEHWREWMRDRLSRKLRSGHYADKSNAVQDVWNEALHVWHMAYGEVPDSGLCAACGEVLSGRDRVIPIIDGAHVHASARCLDAYGEKCREIAAEALVSIGIKAPTRRDG